MHRPWLALLFVLACGSAQPDAAGPGEIAARGPGYQVRVWSDPAEGGDGAGQLVVRVETRGDWHLDDDAPASLRFDPVDACRLDPEMQRRAAAVHDAPERLEFAAGYALTGAEAAALTGHVKFGICEGEDGQCAIVRQAFETRVAARTR